MLDALRFVKGAIATKDYVPELTHFLLQGGRVTGYNGKMSLSAPIGLDVDCCPRAAPFIKAIEACRETAQLALLGNGKLSIRSGGFRVAIDTVSADSYPDVKPEGLVIVPDGHFVEVFARLYPFIAEDASRPWATGLLLDGNTVTATNNVIAVQQWIEYFFPYRVNVPRYAVKELIRIGEEPVSVQLTGTSMTVHYSDGRWLKTQLNSTEWPDVGSMLDRVCDDPFSLWDVPDAFFEALDTVQPFAPENGAVDVRDNYVATHGDAAGVEVPGINGDAVMNVRLLLRLRGVAKQISFEQYPAPCPFFGDQLRGCIAGMNVDA